MSRRPLRFGALVIPTQGGRAVVEQAIELESAGFDLVTVDDHLTLPGRPTAPWAEVWTTLAAIATATTSVRIGPMVSNAILRHPALLARQALTVDDLSGGRLDVGLGSGYAPSDFAAVGREPVDGAAWAQEFAETVATVSAILRGSPVATGGDIDGSTMRPPAGPGETPPLTIAADGVLALDVAARYADHWVSFGGWGLDTDRILALTARRAARLDERCADHGRSSSDVGRTLLAGSSAVNADPIWTSVDAFDDFIGRFTSIGIDTFVLYWPPQSVSKQVDDSVVDAVVGDLMPRLRARS